MSALQKKKMTAKDAIFTGALGAVCIIIRFVMMVVGGFSPYVWFSAHFVDAILIGPVFALIVASIVVGSVIGGLFGLKLMKKHFEKAGLVK